MNRAIIKMKNDTGETLPARNGSSEVLAVISMIAEAARDPSVNMDKLERLLEMKERMLAREARTAYAGALAAARAEIPVIIKNRQVGYDSKKPGASRTDYRHEDLGAIARAIDPVLSRHGLSYRWRTTSNLNEPITVTCIVSHRDGHSEENTLSAGRDDSGNKNAIQSVGSAITYLQRYTLKAALGLAVSQDDDARASGGAATITDEQAEELSSLITETKSDIHRFLRFFKIDAPSALPASRLQEAITLLNQKRTRDA